MHPHQSPADLLELAAAHLRMAAGDATQRSGGDTFSPWHAYAGQLDLTASGLSHSTGITPQVAHHAGVLTHLELAIQALDRIAPGDGPSAFSPARTPSSMGLESLSARVGTTGSGLSEQLDSSLHHWAAEAAEELKRTIPSTQVMANIASIGTLMMATTHRLHTLSTSTTPDELVAMTSDLRGAADALKEAEAAWKTVTTLQPQSRAFGAASYELFDTLRMVLAVPSTPERHREAGLDVDTSLRSLEQGVRDLGRFVEQGHDATRACLNSGLVFAPARGRDNTADHLSARSRGEYLPLATDQAHVVMEPIERAAWLTTRANMRRLDDHVQVTPALW